MEIKKCFTSGTCRLLHLFDEKFNYTNMQSIHYSNVGQYGGKNYLGFANTIEQHLFIMKIIYNDIEIFENDLIELSYLFVMLSNNGDYRKTYMYVDTNYNFLTTLNTLKNEIKTTNIFIYEISSIKEYKLRSSKNKFNFPIFMDSNDISNTTIFEKIDMTLEKMENDISDLITYIKNKNNNAIIIFIGYMRNWMFDSTHPVIYERNMIANVLASVENVNNKIYYIDPTIYLTINDLKDTKHYNFNGKIKILNVINNIISS